MMNHDDTLREIRKLIELHKGIHIESIWGGRQPRITLRVSNHDSLAGILYSSGGANMASHVYSGERDNADRIRYQLEVHEEGEMTEPPSMLQIFGIFMVWGLAHRGILDKGEANRLLTEWNGELVE